MRIDVAQGQKVQHYIIAPRRGEHLYTGVHIRKQVAVGKHHALALARGARCINQCGERVPACRFGSFAYKGRFIAQENLPLTLQRADRSPTAHRLKAEKVLQKG